ncbi:D-2-hydroxyacid dehydrogenase [Paraglaciecola hydrolytica]|uniref:Hydroxyacid dehydrogenase n=1 Tax=Paraglaciecola hydrolytica TaxID=1799789 RepID=A0A136A5J1_9ALTE|nr:D-2-hydroxyacid dehydrogenase [Paraglaciecola hydrolytica]KXI30466.1 hydroxyacid dehydrogenase [Paraglaciecola hydrolytica]
MNAVFLDRDTFNQDIDLSAIEQQCSNLQCYAMTQQTQIIERCKNAHIIISNKVMLSAATLQQLPQLKLVCIAATGTNNIDLIAAKELGITVTNVAAYAKHTVPQYVFAQILAYYSKTEQHNRNTQLGLWSQSEIFCVLGQPMYQLANKTLGLIGYGALAQAVEKIALAFDMQVIIAEHAGAKTIRPGRVSFEQLLTDSDIISLHCPQTPDTTGLINAKVLKQMKPTAMLINTARGALVDNSALLTALQTGEIAYAVLDVLEQEPPPKDHILLNAGLDNLKITAHIAWACQEAQQDLLNIIGQNIESFKQGENLNRIV